MTTVFIDSFSGAASDFKGANRTSDNVLIALAKSPRVSVWDMCENDWLVSCIRELKAAGKIVEVDEPYPWIRYALTDSGKQQIAGGKP